MERVVQRRVLDEYRYPPPLKIIQDLAPVGSRGETSHGTSETFMAAMALDALAEGAFIVTADRRLLFANRAARQILDSGHALYVSDGQVCARMSEHRDAFVRMIRTCSNGGIGAISIRDAPRARLNITTKPMRSLGSVLMLAVEVGKGEEQVAEQLQLAFGLTPAEADIAQSLGIGASPSDTALGRRARLSTVRSQIRSIAEKLGCRRQSEIAAVVQAMPRFVVE